MRGDQAAKEKHVLSPIQTTTGRQRRRGEAQSSRPNARMGVNGGITRRPANESAGLFGDGQSARGEARVVVLIRKSVVEFPRKIQCLFWLLWFRASTFQAL